MSKSKSKLIRPVSCAAFKDSSLDQAGGAVETGVYGNPLTFSTPPIDAATFKGIKDGFSVSLVAAADGGKKAVAEKNKNRELLIRAIRQIGHYVEVACKDDMPTFLLSGLTPINNGPRTKQPPAIPIILSVLNGNSGQFVMRLKSDRKAASFEAKYASLINGTPAVWVTMPFTNARSVQINGLTPAATYTIQVRAIGTVANSDWSDPVTRICT